MSGFRVRARGPQSFKQPGVSKRNHSAAKDGGDKGQKDKQGRSGDVVIKEMMQNLENDSVSFQRLAVSSYQPEDRRHSGDGKRYLPKDWSQRILQFCNTKVCFYFPSSVEDGPKEYKVVFWFGLVFLLGEAVTGFVLSSCPSFLPSPALIMCSRAGYITCPKLGMHLEIEKAKHPTPYRIHRVLFWVTF